MRPGRVARAVRDAPASQRCEGTGRLLLGIVVASRRVRRVGRPGEARWVRGTRARDGRQRASPRRARAARSLSRLLLPPHPAPPRPAPRAAYATEDSARRRR